ncbi:CHAT domain-containing protein [Thelonectria olida]|uniref:CHAT domain-containing protein n=1 Tax=Thelonectria olida TaxID=1576542 RepID=A0A9P9AH92_9HYPO|nr:CHAT domain-containing protein [Thelonectria olida]
MVSAVLERYCDQANEKPTPSRARTSQPPMRDKTMSRINYPGDGIVKAEHQETSVDLLSRASLAGFLTRRSRRTGAMNDLDRAIKVASDKLGSMPQDKPDHALLGDLASNLGLRYQRKGSIDDLSRAIEIATRALDALPPDYPNLVTDWINLGSFYGMRFDQRGLTDDLNHSIDFATRAVNILLPNDPNRPFYLSNLGNSLGKRFEQTGTQDDLESSVHFTTEAVDSMPPNYTHQTLCLSNAANWLGKRFEQTASMHDLNRAIELASAAVEGMLQNDPTRATLLTNLGTQFYHRSDHTGSIEDLNRAIDLTTEALKATPDTHPKRPDRFINLANWYGARFTRLGAVHDLDCAIQLATEGQNAQPQDHPANSAYLTNIGNWLSERFNRKGAFEDLDSAIGFVSNAVDATPEKHAGYTSRLNNLSVLLGIRYEHLGSGDDLDRSVEVAFEAVKIVSSDHRNRALYLHNLSNRLGIRFERIGLLEDLNHAVDVAREAIDIMPAGEWRYMGYLNSLGRRLAARFERTGSMEDLNDAIEATLKAVELAPQDHPDGAGFLTNLGILFGTRSERNGSSDDLERAIEATTKGLNAIPQDHPNRSAYLNNLGTEFSQRFDRTGSSDDLDRAIDLNTEAVQAATQGHPNYGSHLRNLGNLLGKQFKQTGSEDDLNRQTTAYTAGWHCTSAPPHLRIPLAQAAANNLVSQQRLDEACRLLHGAISLLPMVSRRSLAYMDMQGLLADFPGLASAAAAVSLSAGKSPQEALRLLELGRGEPELAEEFISLRDTLDSYTEGWTPLPSEDVLFRESKRKRRREADRAFNMLIEKIRHQPGFHRFLKPATVQDLQAAATPDPIVVINTSSHRCDAFLIEKDNIRVIELPHITSDDVKRRVASLQDASQLAFLLEWLWDAICSPCLDALGFKYTVSDNNWPHVWCIPTGTLSQFPLHAAGRQMQAGERVMDRVVSSYALSVKALIHGRRHHVRKPTTQPQMDSAVLIAMQTTRELGQRKDLPFARAEVEMVEKKCPSLSLHPIIPLSRRDDVLKHLKGCKVFHFAGHGHLDRKEPSKSHLLLDDWTTEPLTVGDLRESRLQENPPFLAYLSACSTGATEAESLSDESIHLVSAFQSAGFRHVIGTLWAVSDKHCADVATCLYETLHKEGMTDAAVSRGLHKALRKLRDESLNSNEKVRNTKKVVVKDCKGYLANFWVPYVHFGA